MAGKAGLCKQPPSGKHGSAGLPQSGVPPETISSGQEHPDKRCAESQPLESPWTSDIQSPHGCKRTRTRHSSAALMRLGTSVWVLDRVATKPAITNPQLHVIEVALVKREPRR